MEKLTEVTPEQWASSPTLLHDRRAGQDARDFRPYTETLLDIIRSRAVLTGLRVVAE